MEFLDGYATSKPYFYSWLNSILKRRDVMRMFDGYFGDGVKRLLRPTYRKIYKSYEIMKAKYRAFYVDIDHLLCGGENGIRAAKYAELIGDL